MCPDRLDMPGPVLLLVIPGLLMTPDTVSPVVIDIKTAAEPQVCVPVLADPVEVHGRFRIFSHAIFRQERIEILACPPVYAVVI